ncbi:MAG: hypothetical protein HXS50_01795 [Theionarchaea archaeon]|nr:hypothetical protein [Theionarchaea archaeon]
MADRVLAFIASLLLVVPVVLPMETRINPADQKIRALYGRAPSSPYTFALEDPRISVLTALPYLSYSTPYTDLEYGRRLARIYLPRNYESFLEKTDLIALEDIDSAIFTPEKIMWFKRAIEEEGLGLVMGGGSQGFGGNDPFNNWCETALNDLIPVECTRERLSKDYLVKFRVLEPDNELAKSLPWEEAPLYYPCNLIYPKQGCTVIIESDDNVKTPIYFYWDVGRGRFLGVQNLKGVFGQAFEDWNYFIDTVLNAYYFTVSFPLPPDLLTLHELRRKWHETNIQKELLISMIDFADKFGANTVGIESGMEEVESIQETSNGLYLDQDYLGSLQQLELVISRIFELEELALELKDRALLWIYIIEWMSVFGTAMISGTLLWTIMIRRRLYRETGTTTFRL